MSFKEFSSAQDALSKAAADGKPPAAPSTDTPTDTPTDTSTDKPDKASAGLAPASKP